MVDLPEGCRWEDLPGDGADYPMKKWGGMGGCSWCWCWTCKRPGQEPPPAYQFPFNLIEENASPDQVIEAVNNHLAQYPDHKMEVIIDGRWELE